MVGLMRPTSRSLRLRYQCFRPVVLEDPQSAVHVADENVALEWLRAPGQRRIGNHRFALLAPGDVPPCLPSLGVEVAPQVARNVDDSEAALIIGNVQDTILDPDVVGAGLRHFEFGYFDGVAGNSGRTA